MNPLTAFMNSNNSTQGDKKPRSKTGKNGGGPGKSKAPTEASAYDEVDEAIVCMEDDAEPIMSKSKSTKNGDDGVKKPRQRNRELQK
jgi:hypothetical protein